MKKVLVGAMVVMVSLFVYATSYGFFKYSDTTKYLNVEKTGASLQEIVPAVASRSIVIKSISLFLDAAGSVYFYQGSTATNKVLMPKAEHDGNFGYSKQYATGVKEKDILPTLDSGNALNMWTSVDPDEGWVEVEFEYANVE